MDTVEDDVNEENQDEAPYTKSFERREREIFLRVPSHKSELEVTNRTKSNADTSPRASHVINLSSKTSDPNSSNVLRASDKDKHELFS